MALHHAKPGGRGGERYLRGWRCSGCLWERGEEILFPNARAGYLLS